MIPKDAAPGTALTVTWVPESVRDLVRQTIVPPLWVTARRAYQRPDAAPFPFQKGEAAVLEAIVPTAILMCGYGVKVYGHTGSFAPHHFDVRRQVLLPGLGRPLA